MVEKKGVKAAHCLEWHIFFCSSGSQETFYITFDAYCLYVGVAVEKHNTTPQFNVSRKELIYFPYTRNVGLFLTDKDLHESFYAGFRHWLKTGLENFPYTSNKNSVVNCSSTMREESGEMLVDPEHVVIIVMNGIH